MLSTSSLRQIRKYTVWTECLDVLRDELSENAFALWIRPLNVLESEGVLTLLAPNQYFTRYIKENYLARIEELVQQLSEQRIEQVRVQVDSSREGILENPLILDESESEAEELSVVAESPLPLDESVRARPISSPTLLNPAFTFDHFVQGQSNQMAYTACQAVAHELGGDRHNPLFLYGATGLGKTHLMQAVGHTLLAQNPGAQVLYLTSESFVSRFIRSLQQKRIDEFKQICRNVDLLLLDDIHLMAGKEASLEEFFYTFNAILDNSRQIILTSNRYPKQLVELDDRLISRLTWGLVIGIEPPDLETRIEILLKKARQSQINLPRNGALFIAQHVQANVRELEGALNKVVATALFKGVAIDIELIREALRDSLALTAQVTSIDNIQKVVADYFRISLKDLNGPKRTRNLARPRQIAMGLVRELTDQSFPDIGRAFGGRDHTTVMHACEKVKSLRETDRLFDQDYQQLLKLLRG